MRARSLWRTKDIVVLVVVKQTGLLGDRHGSSKGVAKGVVVGGAKGVVVGAKGVVVGGAKGVEQTRSIGELFLRVGRAPFGCDEQVILIVVAFVAHVLIARHRVGR